MWEKLPCRREKSSSGWSLICCILCPSCTVLLNGVLGYIIKVECNSLLHRMTSLKASNFIKFDLQPSFCDRSDWVFWFSGFHRSLPTNNESSSGGEPSSFWFLCNSWRRLIPIFRLSSLEVVALLLLHLEQRHLCVRKILERSCFLQHPECVAGISVFQISVVSCLSFFDVLADGLVIFTSKKQRAKRWPLRIFALRSKLPSFFVVIDVWSKVSSCNGWIRVRVRPCGTLHQPCKSVPDSILAYMCTSTFLDREVHG